MTTEKTTEEFETWFKGRFWHECYEDVKHHLFAAWQASREAVVIELPTPKASPRNSSSYVEGKSDGFESAIYLCQGAIEDAGLKVKP